MYNYKRLKTIEDVTDIFEVGNLLGQGNFGQVNLATRNSNGQTCALKMVQKDALQENPLLG